VFRHQIIEQWGKTETKRQSYFILLVFLLITTTASAFRIPQARAIGVIRILSDGTISPLGAPIITLDKITYTLDAPNIVSSISVERSNIVIDGAGYAVTGDGSGNGFTLIGVSNVTIKNTNIQNFTYGIYAETTTFIVVTDNNLTKNTYDGIGLFYCDTVTVQANRLAHNDYDGVEIYNCSNNNVEENYIATNAWFGIGIYEYSTGNVTRNKIVDNYNGIELSYSSNIKIFHNDFINHTQHASTQFSLAVWDNGYPSGGNYWSDNTGTDIYSGPYQNETGSDRINDTPYNCSGNNQDRYPLMQTYTNIATQRVDPSKTIVGQGYNASIEILVRNEGWEAQTTTVTIYVNTTLLSNFTNLSMTERNNTALTITWQTAAYTRGNYTISVTATVVPKETDTIDNNCTWMVHVGVPGDVSSSTQGVYDGIVNMRDIQYMILLFNAKPNSTKWNPNADVNNDLVVNMRDINIAIMNFNKQE
jgi:parallel beta-helix repeat protein